MLEHFLCLLSLEIRKSTQHKNFSPFVICPYAHRANLPFRAAHCGSHISTAAAESGKRIYVIHTSTLVFPRAQPATLLMLIERTRWMAVGRTRFNTHTSRGGGETFACVCLIAPFSLPPLCNGCESAFHWKVPARTRTTEVRKCTTEEWLI